MVKDMIETSYRTISPTKARFTLTRSIQNKCSCSCPLSYHFLSVVTRETVHAVQQSAAFALKIPAKLLARLDEQNIFYKALIFSEILLSSCTEAKHIRQLLLSFLLVFLLCHESVHVQLCILTVQQILYHSKALGKAGGTKSFYKALIFTEILLSSCTEAKHIRQLLVCFLLVFLLCHETERLQLCVLTLLWIPQQSSWQGWMNKSFIYIQLRSSLKYFRSPAPKPSMSGTGHLSIMYMITMILPTPAAALQGLSISRHSSPITLRIFSQLFRIPKAVNKNKLNIPATVCILWSGWGEGGEGQGEEGDMKMKKGDKNLYIVIKSYTLQKETLYFKKIYHLIIFLLLCCTFKIKVRSNC